MLVRLGMFVPLPGLDPVMMGQAGWKQNWLQMFQIQSSGVSGNIFQLGLGPYLNASIFLSMILSWEQVGKVFAPKLVEAQKSGLREQIQLWINNLTLAIGLLQGAWEAQRLSPYAVDASGFVLSSCFTLVAGAMVQVWLCRLVDEYGIGEGVGVLIVCSIASELARVFDAIINAWSQSDTMRWNVCIVAVCWMVFTGCMCMLKSMRLSLRLRQYRFRQSERKKFFKRKDKQEYFHLLANPGGILPVIFVFPIFTFISYVSALPVVGLPLRPLDLLIQNNIIFHHAFLITIILLANLSPLASARPSQMAEFLGNINSTVEGVAPGQATQQYLQQKSLSIRLWGGIFLAFITVCATIFDNWCKHVIGVDPSTISLILVVSVVNSAWRQVLALVKFPQLRERVRTERKNMDGLITI